MVRQNERRLLEIAAGHPAVPRRSFQAWASATQTEWIATLEGTGYQSVRRFANMRHRFDEIPDWKLPAGLEIRPVQADQMRSIWEARRDLELEVFEGVAERWTEDRYQSWSKDPSQTPALWQVAWEGDQLVGMVLNHVNEEENRKTGIQRGYTEHIFIRKAWRRRGLIITLLSRSLHLLKDMGMEEAVLGVDMQNASGAYDFYRKMGFQTFSTDLWYRKPMTDPATRKLSKTGSLRKGKNMDEKIMIPEAPNIPGLTFRRFRGESDYPHMAALINACKAADHVERISNMEEVARTSAT